MCRNCLLELFGCTVADSVSRFLGKKSDCCQEIRIHDDVGEVVRILCTCSALRVVDSGFGAVVKIRFRLIRSV